MRVVGTVNSRQSLVWTLSTVSGQEKPLETGLNIRLCGATSRGPNTHAPDCYEE